MDNLLLSAKNSKYYNNEIDLRHTNINKSILKY